MTNRVYNYVVDSFFLNGNHPYFGTLWLFALIRQEFDNPKNRDELTYATVLFKINSPKWLYNWWTRKYPPYKQ